MEPIKLLAEKVVRKEYVSKAGKPYTKVFVNANNKLYTAFSGKWNDEWKDGDTIEACLVKNGDFLNLEPVGGTSKASNNKILEQVFNSIEELKKQNAKILYYVKQISKLDESEEPLFPEGEDAPF